MSEVQRQHIPESQHLYLAGVKVTPVLSTLLEFAVNSIVTDATNLLPRRFLRARRWIPADAYTQFSENEAFRKANQIDVLYETMDVEAYERTKTLVRTYGHDKPASWTRKL